MVGPPRPLHFSGSRQFLGSLRSISWNCKGSTRNSAYLTLPTLQVPSSVVIVVVLYLKVSSHVGVLILGQVGRVVATGTREL